MQFYVFFLSNLTSRIIRMTGCVKIQLFAAQKCCFLGGKSSVLTSIQPVALLRRNPSKHLPRILQGILELTTVAVVAIVAVRFGMMNIEK